MIAGLPLIKKIFFLLAVALLLVTNLGAQTVKAVNASSDLPHPRLYFTSQDIVQLRALRNAPSHQAIWNNIKSWADAHVGDQPPAIPTDLGGWWGAAFDIRDYIETVGFVYAMTDDTAYADGVKNWMVAVAGWGEWGPDFLPSMITLPMAFGYDILHDYLAASELSTIRSAIVSNTETTISRYNWVVDTSYEDYPNGIGAAVGGVGCAALVLEGEYDTTAWLSWGISKANLFLEFGDVDGGWFEGTAYGAFSLSQFIPFLDALKRIKGQNLFDNDFLREHANYYIYMAYNGGFVQFEDVNWAVDIKEYNLYFIYRLASEYGNGYAQWFADQYASKSRMQSYLWKDPNLTATPPTDLPLTKQFGDIGYVIFKTGWEANDLLFAFKSGSSRGHAHPSQNEFGIYYQGVPITCGPGYVCMEPEDATWSHNCLLVDGNGQCQEPGDYQSAPLGTRGEILQVDVRDPYYRYALGDASAVYTGWSGTSDGRSYTVGELDKWLRHVVFVEPNYFVIYDEVAASSPKQFDWLLQGYSGSSLSVEGDTITLLKNGVKLEVKVLAPEGFVTEKTNYDNCDHLKVRPSASTTQTQFLTVYYPLTTNESMLPTEKVSVGNVIGAKVTNRDTLDLILFSKDGNPVDEYIELGGHYKAIDGGDYLFEGTGVRVQFDSYQVLRLQESVDVTPPVITSIAASNITGASATISWSTDEPSTSQVDYGITEDLGLSSGMDTTLVTNHSVSLTDLANSTTYHYKVKSRDAAGNLAISEAYNFTTLSPYLSISFTPPTDADNILVDRNWTEINTSIDGTFGVSSFIDWNRSLAGYWNFNENSGNTANDKSTYGNNGTLKNDPQWTTGKFGNALEFDSMDDYVDCGSDPSLDITDEITIEVWINPATAQEVCGDGETGNYGVAGKAEEGISGTVWSWQLRYGSPDNCRLGFQFNGDPEGSRWVTVKQNLTPGEWYHIVGTFDGTDIKCYLNGALKDTNQISGIKSSNAKLFIAEEGWHNYFHGLIDEVRIWNRALSEEEIEASYNTNLHSLSHKFTELADGTYEYYAYATDLSGNSAETETRTLIIDTDPSAISTATLEGHVTFTERGSNNTKWAESFNVTLFEAGNLSNVLWTGNATTNNIGVFTVSGLTPATYDIEIKNWTCLSELVTNQTLTAGNTTVVNFGTTREGDANNDDHITILDVSSLASSYDSSEGDPDWNPHCDFNRDGNISILDASALVSNYGQDGDLT